MRLFIILLLFITSIFATNLPHTYVIHINGIGTTQQEAIINAEALQSAMTIHTNLVANSKVKYIYNPTHGFFFDILEDLQVQKAKENQVISIDDDVKAYMLDHNLSYPVGSAQYNAIKNQMQPLYTNELYKAAGVDFDYVLSQFHNLVPSQPPTQFADIVNLLYNDANAYVVFVPHSQGNLYANVLYTYLNSVEGFDANRMSILGIGSPAQKIYGTNSSYITASNDFVIGASRILYGHVLPSNNHIDTSNDILNHSLIDAYLHDRKTFSLISNMLNDKIANFSNDILDFDKDPALKAKLTSYYVTQIIDPSGNTVCYYDTCKDTVGYYYHNGYPIFAFANSDMASGTYQIYTEINGSLSKSFIKLGADVDKRSAYIQSRNPLTLGIDRPNCIKSYDKDGNPIMNPDGTQKASCTISHYEKNTYTSFYYFLPFDIADYNYYYTNLPSLFSGDMVLLGDFSG